MRKRESASPGVFAALTAVRGSSSARVLSVGATGPGGGARGPARAAVASREMQSRVGAHVRIRGLLYTLPGRRVSAACIGGARTGRTRIGRVYRRRTAGAAGGSGPARRFDGARLRRMVREACAGRW